MQANPINSAAVKTEPSQTADRSAAVKGSRQASKAAVTGPYHADALNEQGKRAQSANENNDCKQEKA